MPARSATLALTLLLGCAPEDTVVCVPDSALDTDFDRSAGGVPEVDPAWVRAHHCDVRVVDLRQPEERAVSRLPFGEHVPMGELGEVAESWDPRAPVVLVCRSGRRSAQATRTLEDMGFARVASMTGGLLMWEARGLPLAAGATPSRAKSEPSRALATGPLDRVQIRAHLGDATQIHWVKAASLVLQATQSCVDGRDPHAVVGTLGGDAGELLLALAALERVRGEPLDQDAIRRALDARLDAFGTFYLHTDTHALATLAASDPRFAGHDPEALVRHPPRALEAPLLEALGEPEHVGCGHLRLALTHPEAYAVRRALTVSLLQAVFRRLWQGAPIDLVVLEGEHQESGVLTIRVPHEVHPFTRIPTVMPRVGDHALFVSHPQVSAWLRAQTASSLFETDPWLAAHPERREALLEQLAQLGERQQAATLSHLAAGLPAYEATVDAGSIRVVGPTGP